MKEEHGEIDLFTCGCAAGGVARELSVKLKQASV